MCLYNKVKPSSLQQSIDKSHIAGLERFGVKLGDASKLFGKKFAAGASITKNPQDIEQIEVQGDFLEKAAEFVFKQFNKDGVKKGDIFVIQNKKKEPYYDESSDEE